MTQPQPTTPPLIQPTPWCVIPVYNNATTIRDIARRARQQMPHVLIIDDGSTDANLTSLLHDLDVVVIRHPENRGKGVALLTALRFAADQKASHIITLDGDGQHFPEDLPLFLNRLGPDVILLGQRVQIEGQMPQTSQFGRTFSDFWIYVETGTQVSDTQSGFRAYPVPAILHQPFCSRHYNFEVEVITRALWAGLRVEKIPIRVWYPESHKRVSSFRPFRDNLRISLLHTRLVGRQLLPFSHTPIRAATVRERPIPSNSLWSRMLHENASPLGLAAAAGVGVLFGSLPLGLPLVLYLAFRLHLNKPMALAIQLLCVLPLFPIISITLGYALLHGHWPDLRHPLQLLQNAPSFFVEWLLGAFLLSPIYALPTALIVYTIACRLKRSATT